MSREQKKGLGVPRSKAAGRSAAPVPPSGRERPPTPSRELVRIRQRVALKVKCNEIADKKWPASPQEERRYERSREAVGYSDALFAVAEGRCKVPALGIGSAATKERVRRTGAKRTTAKPDPKGNAQKKKQRS